LCDSSVKIFSPAAQLTYQKFFACGADFELKKIITCGANKLKINNNCNKRCTTAKQVRIKFSNNNKQSNK